MWKASVKQGTDWSMGYARMKWPALPAQRWFIRSCFCYRHSLELQIKGLMFRVLDGQASLGQIDATAAEAKEKDFARKHGLKPLWDMLYNLDPLIDAWADGSQKAGFLDLLCELDKQDPIAQAGRYPVDSKGNQTLTGLSIVDMGNVKTAANKIARYLETIEFRLIEDFS
jgi:hypothetical protein